MINYLIANGIIAGAIYSLIALGFTLIYRTVKFFHLAHGAVYAVGAYVGYGLVIGLNWNPVVSFFLPLQLRGLSVYLLIESFTSLCVCGRRPILFICSPRSVFSFSYRI